MRQVQWEPETRQPLAHTGDGGWVGPSCVHLSHSHHEAPGNGPAVLTVLLTLIPIWQRDDCPCFMVNVVGGNLMF